MTHYHINYLAYERGEKVKTAVAYMGRLLGCY